MLLLLPPVELCLAYTLIRSVGEVATSARRLVEFPKTLVILIAENTIFILGIR